jgi:hypothetical protein
MDYRIKTAFNNMTHSEIEERKKQIYESLMALSVECHIHYAPISHCISIKPCAPIYNYNNN